MSTPTSVLQIRLPDSNNPLEQPWSGGRGGYLGKSAVEPERKNSIAQNRWEPREWWPNGSAKTALSVRKLSEFWQNLRVALTVVASQAHTLCRTAPSCNYPQLRAARIVSLNAEESLDVKMNALDRTHAVYCGSFDPLTLGHLDIIRRGAGLFATLTVAVGINPDKKPLFEPERRVSLITRAVGEFDNVQVRSFGGLAVDFAMSLNAGVLLRGVRSLSDTESEFTMSLANLSLIHI